MIRPGDRIENPVTGEVLIFHRTAERTDAEAVLFETIVRPNGTVTSGHVHPNQTERFEVREGTLGRSAFELLDRGGRMLSFGLASGGWADVSDEVAVDRGVTVVRWPRATPEELRAFTESALAEAAAGRLRPVIGQRFPLDRAADAHAAIESRATVGKTLLDVR